MRVRRKYWLLPIMIAMALLGVLIVLSQGSAIHELAQQVQPERWIVQAGHDPTVDVPRIARGCRRGLFVGPFPGCQSECSNNYDGS